jgi:uncharacterized protein (DUF1501 family)
MRFLQPQLHSRRAFLRRSAQLALTGAALPTAMNLAAIGEAAAFNANDYKALVCVFLFGGNDYGNTVVPYDSTNYDLYSAIRTGVSLSRSSLAPTLLTPTAALANGRQFALHPSMTGLAGLFNSGNAAVQLNVGPLVAPTTRAGYRSSNRVANPLPPKLFSHNDQQSTWQSFATEGSTVGWGGNMGDLALSSNGTNSLFTCMSVSGNTVFLSGDSAMSYQVGTSGAVKVRGVTSNVYGSGAVRAAMDLLTQETRSHKLEQEYNRVTKRSINASNAVTTGLEQAYALDTHSNFASFTGIPSNNSLASQLKMVARLIAARNDLGVKRQVFFVSLGGFDMHDGLINGHVNQLGRVSAALTAFYESTVAMGVANNVTAFTASDFGRTLASNGDGSDHGWGSHHLMVGGAVNGAAFYGAPPPVSVGNSTTDAFDQWHVGSGRLLPSTSVDQYVATMARWFGVEAGEMSGVIPNISRFGNTDYPTNLGFMKTSA